MSQVTPVASTSAAAPTLAEQPRPVAPAAAVPPPSAALDPLVAATSTTQKSGIEAFVERAEAAINRTVESAKPYADKALETAQPIAHSVSTKAQEFVRELHLPELRDTVVGGAQNAGEAVRRGSAGFVAPSSPPKSTATLSPVAAGKRPEGSTLTTQVEPPTAAPSSLAAQGQPGATVPERSLGEQAQGFFRRASATMAQITHSLEQLGDKAFKQVEEAFSDTTGKPATNTAAPASTSTAPVAPTAVAGSAPPPHNELKEPWNKPEATQASTSSAGAPAIATTTNTVPHATS